MSAVWRLCELGKGLLERLDDGTEETESEDRRSGTYSVISWSCVRPRADEPPIDRLRGREEELEGRELVVVVAERWPIADAFLSACYLCMCWTANRSRTRSFTR